MSSAFTVLWNSDRVKIAKRQGLVGKPIPVLFGGPHNSQPSFIRAGVKPGDIVYPIGLKAGVIYVLAQVVTAEILPIKVFEEKRAEFYDALGYPGELPPWHRAVRWTCTEEALMPAQSSLCSVTVKLTPDMVTRLTYRSQRAQRSPKGIKDGRLLSALGVQGAYRLGENSAEDFSSLFPA